MIRATTVSDLLATYVRHRFLCDRTVLSYGSSVRSLSEFCGGYLLISELQAETIVAWLHSLRDEHKSAATLNRHRRSILALCRFALSQGLISELIPNRIPRAPEPRRAPTSWTIEEISAILRNCEAGLPRRRGSWSAAHWRALLLTAYETSLRVGCLLNLRRQALNTTKHTLFVPAELQKHRGDTLHRLHPDTVAELVGLTPTPALFPWPLKGHRQIWQYYRRILSAAGLPIGRRDLFHKLRRTSYTHVYAALGPGAASLHAGHDRDMSRYYLDRLQASNLFSAIDVLPRPSL